MTYHCMKQALEWIASGVANPVGVAKEALRDRRPPRKPSIHSAELPSATRRKERRERDIAFFCQWIDEGKPTYREIGAPIGISAAVAMTRIRCGRHHLCRPEGKDHPYRAAAVESS